MKLRRLLFGVLMLLSCTWANEVVERPKPPVETLLPWLEPIESKAIRMGTGAVKVHVFIDPFCPRSRDFVSFVSGSEKMLSRYSYFFYLYRLDRFDSQGMINAIYSSSSPRETMLDIMVKEQNLTMETATPDINATIRAVADAARRIDVYKRPYMIMLKQKPIKAEHK